jgi:hypothetical protein
MKCISDIRKKYFYIGQGYSDERCGPWASCFFLATQQSQIKRLLCLCQCYAWIQVYLVPTSGRMIKGSFPWNHSYKKEVCTKLSSKIAPTEHSVDKL